MSNNINKYSVNYHWDPLKVCLVGKTYPPEFYSWVTDNATRARFEKLAEETEEDYQGLIDLLTKVFQIVKHLIVFLLEQPSFHFMIKKYSR
jgi:hypothetical protein